MAKICTINGYKIKAEYSTNDNDIQVIVVTETSGQKIVMWNNNPLYNYYDIIEMVIL